MLLDTNQPQESTFLRLVYLLDFRSASWKPLRTD